MNASNLLYDLEVFASNGVVFSKEQKATLQNSLTVTKAQYNFSRISFWGKINGLKDDYFIAQGYRKNMKNDESSLQTLYSLNAADWCILEEVEQSVRDLALTLRGRFIGDPSFSYDCIDPNPENNIDNNNNSTEENNNNKLNGGERFGQGDYRVVLLKCQVQGGPGAQQLFRVKNNSFRGQKAPHVLCVDTHCLQ